MGVNDMAEEPFYDYQESAVKGVSRFHNFNRPQIQYIIPCHKQSLVTFSLTLSINAKKKINLISSAHLMRKLICSHLIRRPSLKHR